ncbi:hypothetical protein O6H91_04G041900 [Diphasiastrum complanatum]|uniref:Uncharacterized protein n=1 Tax=Diphasiastrum complanatum TaxID=34168 RepID=A0ACC2DWM5_DIPCM|nr:hypothetical protein O6H91_04G041900 [Diphasiastrum complanatum]
MRHFARDRCMHREYHLRPVAWWGCQGCSTCIRYHTICPVFLLPICHVIGGRLSPPPLEQSEALQQIATSIVDRFKHLHDQVQNVLLETLDDSDPTTRELALVVILEILNNQNEPLEGRLEILLEKLLYASKDQVPKVSCAADSFLSSILSQWDPYECLSVVVPLLASEE